MRKIMWIMSIALTALTGGPGARAQEKPVPAFPGAEGFGACTPGGRGGKVMIVTNLNPDGPGSLQEACAAEGPRIVVFAVSGVIRNMITIENSNITIAGQTAPGAGITIEGQLVSKEGISDVVIRHLRVRPLKVADSYAGPEGEARARRQHACGLGNPGLSQEQKQFRIEAVRADPGEWHDAVQLNGVKRLILDHLTASWAADEIVSVCRSTEVTVQWCTIESGAVGEGTKFNGYHSNGLFSAYNRKDYISIHHNLFAHTMRRNPTVRDGAADIRNNVIYNYRQGFSHDGGSSGPFNIVGNVYKIGPNSNKPAPQATWWGSRVKTLCLDPKVPYHLADNRDFHDATLDLRLGPVPSAQKPFDMPPVTTQPAMDAYELVLARAGAFPRDAVTQRTIEEARTGKGDWGRREPEGGLMAGLTPADPPVDTDKDGMPDEWEKKHGLDRARDDSAKVMEGGYTAVEVYINELAAQLLRTAMARTNSTRNNQ
jgi:pectate lyase